MALPSHALTLGDAQIRQHDGLFSLNDLHAAAGGEERHRPGQFLRIEQTQELVRELETAQISAVTTREGRNGGTYACRELVIAYAAWISAAFHLRVIRVFLAQQSAPSPATGINPRTLLLSGQSDPTIAPPARVQAAIDRRAWQLAGEAHALLREHLQRRVAFASEVGVPRRINEARALQAIAGGGLGDALAHEYVARIDGLRSTAHVFLRMAQGLVSELDAVASHGTQSASSATDSIAASACGTSA